MSKKTLNEIPLNPLSEDLVAPLLSWYRENRRILPWREGKDPYRIWISEIMLQQTRIEAVIPYYHRFLSELPNVAALASADDERLMKLWEGLGYYSRVRNLKAAAKTVMSEHGGVIPQDFSSLRALSGIGDYTAGAIASIAFGKPEPAVDGNVLRVIMRLTGREDDISESKTKKAVTEWLRAIYPNGADAGDLTEGIMELGENICIPAGIPKCADCPLRTLCVAHKETLWSELPKKSPKKERRVETLTVLLLRYGDRIALRKRPADGLLAGLWEFPNLSGKLSLDETERALLHMGIHSHDLRTCGDASHIFTHITWNMTGIAVTCDGLSDGFVWFTREELEHEVAIPTAFRFYLKQILTEESAIWS